MSRTIRLGKPPALTAEGEKQVFSSPNSVLISPCELPNDLWTQPKVSSEKKASRLPPIRSLFFHHYDWNRWFASLATTVDNTIKMADRSLKHGRQWCIRRIVSSRMCSSSTTKEEHLGSKRLGNYQNFSVCWIQGKSALTLSLNTVVFLCPATAGSC